MTINADFPHPPKHHRDKNESNFKSSPDVSGFLKRNPIVNLFGQQVEIASRALKILPDYSTEARTKLFIPRGVKENFHKLLFLLKNKVREYFECLVNQSEKAKEKQVEIHDIYLHLFYLTKMTRDQA